MIEVNVSASTAELARGFNNLSRKEIIKATSDAINRTLMLGRTEARKEVKKIYNIPSRYLNFVNIVRSRPSNLTGNINARTLPLPMDAFNPVFKIIRKGKVVGVQKISRRGQVKSAVSRFNNSVGGVTIEITKGNKRLIPYAFLLPGAKARVFARGKYLTGGSYDFIRRNKREENSSGNDSVTNMLSVTVYGAIMNDRVLNNINTKVTNGYEANLMNALRRQANRV